MLALKHCYLVLFSLHYDYVIMFVQIDSVYHTKSLLEFLFSSPCRLSSLRISRLISKEKEELYKNYLRLKTPDLIRILRLAEILAFL